VEKRILIVEDSPTMRQLIALAVRGVKGAVVEEADDGLAALKKLKAGSYDLLFLDLNMPVMDGMKLLKAVRADPVHQGAKIAVVTTEESPETEQQARSLGANYYLRKPVARRALEKVLAEVFPG
jgi:two-component system chemotaxis response regulator CheY